MLARGDLLDITDGILNLSIVLHPNVTYGLTVHRPSTTVIASIETGSTVISKAVRPCQQV